jgi:WD40 repeat protein
MDYVATLPKPFDSSSLNDGVGVIGVRLNSDNTKLHCIYSDRSYIVWDLKDLKKIGLYRSFINHNAGIWSVDQNQQNQNLLTASVDGTLKVWNLDQNQGIVREEE